MVPAISIPPKIEARCTTNLTLLGGWNKRLVVAHGAVDSVFSFFAGGQLDSPAVQASSTREAVPVDDKDKRLLAADNCFRLKSILTAEPDNGS
jgi:hypothetical protein